LSKIITRDNAEFLEQIILSKEESEKVSRYSLSASKRKMASSASLYALTAVKNTKVGEPIPDESMQALTTQRKNGAGFTDRLKTTMTSFFTIQNPLSATVTEVNTAGLTPHL